MQIGFRTVDNLRPPTVAGSDRRARAGVRGGGVGRIRRGCGCDRIASSRIVRADRPPRIVLVEAGLGARRNRRTSTHDRSGAVAHANLSAPCRWPESSIWRYAQRLRAVTPKLSPAPARRARAMVTCSGSGSWAGRDQQERKSHLEPRAARYAPNLGRSRVAAVTRRIVLHPQETSNMPWPGGANGSLERRAIGETPASAECAGAAGPDRPARRAPRRRQISPVGPGEMQARAPTFEPPCRRSRVDRRRWRSGNRRLRSCRGTASSWVARVIRARRGAIHCRHRATR